MRFSSLHLGWTAAAIATAAVVLEATVRFDDWAQFGVPITARPVGIDELAVLDSLGYHARANTAFRQFRINSLGFRGPEVSLSEHKPVIITTGASETFGLYEKPGNEWPRQLADSLGACGERVTVLNAAFAGMSLPTVRQDFATRLRRFSPKVVIYYPTPMQYLYEKAPVPAIPREGPVAALPQFRSRAIPRFRDALKRSLPQPALDAYRRADMWSRRKRGGSSPKPAVERERLDWFERDLRTLIGEYRAAGATPILVVHSNRFSDTTSAEARRWLTAWERFYPAYTGTAIVRYDALAAERIKQVGQDSAVTVVDARHALRAVGNAFSDYSHFNDRGSAIVGGAVARAVAPEVCGMGN